MKKVVIVILVFLIGNEIFSQNVGYVSLSYGTANQPNGWINDLYLGWDVYEITPESRFHGSLNVGKSFSIKKGKLNVGLGIRREYFTSSERYQNERSFSTAAFYSGVLNTSYAHNYSLSPQIDFFWEAGVNWQVYNLLYRDRSFAFATIQGSHLSIMGGDTVKNETMKVNLKSKAPYSITPQSKIGVGFISKLNNKNSIKVSLAFENDILKSNYLLYSFELEDKKTNTQINYTAESRKIRRLYFSVGLTYLFSISN